MALMNSECIHLKSGLAHEHTPMIGRNAHSFIPGRMLGGGTHGNITIVVFHALIFARVHVGEGICVSMLMVSLSVGFTLLNIEQDSAKMGLVVIVGFVSLLTFLRNSDPSMLRRAPVSLHRGLLLWIWLRP